MKTTAIFLRTTLLLFLLLASVTLASGKAHAGPALVQLEDYVQPSGEHFSASIHGDEWKNWVATDKDEVIIQGSDKFWYYVQISNGKLITSSERYAIDTPPTRIITSKDVDEMNRNSPAIGLKFNNSSLSLSQSPAGAPLKSTYNLSTPHKLLVLLVSFSDKAIQNSEVTWNAEFFGASNSVNSYYKEVSNNQFYFEPAAETSGTTDDGVIKVTLNRPHPNTGSHTDVRNEQIVKDALIAANAKINFASFDKNLDTYISSDELHVVTIIAGNEGSHGDPAPTVWGHRFVIYNIAPPNLDNVVIADPNHRGGYVQVGEMHGSHIAQIGILAHELGHDLGLPDLYDTTQPVASSKGLGIHSIMASGSWGRTGGSFEGGSPTHFDAWSKMFLGFTSAPEATTTNLVDAAAGDVYRVSTSNPTEYYLIENRQFSGYDAALATELVHGGLAIYHIDEAVISAKLSSNTVENAVLHKGIKIMEANQALLGYSQLDTKAAYPYDHYFAGSSAYSTLSSATTPNSNLYDGSASEVTIIAISPSSNAMNVTVVGPATSPNASLRSIILSQGTVSPQFSGAVLNYTATVTGSTTSVTVTPTVAIAGSTITVNGTPVTSGTASGAINLNLGSNNIVTIQVKSQDASVTKNYIVDVDRSQGVRASFIALSKRELNLTLTSPKVNLTTLFTPLNATMKNITWTSNDPSVATVVYGTITAVGTGSTTVEAKTDGGLTDVVVVNVTIPVAKVELDKDKATLGVGDADITLHETVTPVGATNKNVIWSSSNVKSVTVDASGTIHAVAPGTAIITATSQIGAKSAKATVTVPTKATTITIAPSTLILTMGQTAVTLKGLLTPTTATYKTLTWSSNDTSIVRVDPLKGTVSPVAVGDTVVKVTNAEGITNQIPVKVLIRVSKLVLSPSVTTIVYEATPDLNMEPTIEPSNATNKDIVWSSSAPRVATVDSLGIAHAFNAGTTVLTAKTVDSAKIASKTITVNGISLNVDELYMRLDKPTLLKAALFNTGTERRIIWESSDPTIAEVSSTGLVTPKLIGETTITASTYDRLFSDTVKVTIIQTSVASITLDPKLATLKIGDADLKLIPTIGPADASITKVVWTSSNTATATVDSSGNVHALIPGTAIITATTDDGAKSAKVTVTVPIPVASVKITNTGPITLNINTATALKSAITPTTAKDLKVTWSSVDPLIANVGTTGIVRGIAAGTTNIKVTTNDGSFTDTIAVTVIIPNSKISFISPKETLKVGAADITLVPIFSQADATNKTIIWTSSSPAVAAVNENGVVHALSTGTATITATTVEGAKAAKFTVTVPSSVKSIKIMHADNIYINLKAAIVLKTSVLPLSSTNQKVTWKSSNESVASVNETTGAVKSFSTQGSAVITATTVDGSLTDTITVNVVKTITTLSINKPTISLSVGGADFALIAKILPTDATDKTIIWESSNPAAATVDSNGLVHPVSAGKATISATSKDGSKTVKSAITVK